MAGAAPPEYFEPPLSRARIDGQWRAWRECGAGSALPLLLLHGIGSNARAWAGQFAALAGERRLIAWNAPGYADSDPLPQAWPQAADYAEAALGLLDHLGVERCIVVGQSLGAIMGAALARRAPGRVAALALASPASGYGIAPGAALPERVQRRLDDLRTLGPKGLADRRASALLTERAGAVAREIVHQAMAEIEPAGYAGAVRLLAGSDLAGLVSGLDLPGCVIWGDADGITPPSGCRLIAQAFRGAGAIELAGLGHGFATEAPDRFNQAIRPLLAAADTMG